MAIGRPQIICCKNIKCKKKFLIILGDEKPKKIVCPKCGKTWFV